MNILLLIILVFIVIFINKGLTKSDEYITVNKDFMTPSVPFDEVSEYKPYQSSYKTAWSEMNIDKNPKYHNYSLMDEKYDIGASFDKNNQYKKRLHLPEKCIIKDGELVCRFNDRVEVPPKELIDDKENNLVLKNIGDDKDINTNIISSKNISFGRGNYNIWESEDESIMNGGKYFNNVTGYSMTSNSSVLNDDKGKIKE